MYYEPSNEFMRCFAPESKRLKDLVVEYGKELINNSMFEVMSSDDINKFKKLNETLYLNVIKSELERIGDIFTDTGMFDSAYVARGEHNTLCTLNLCSQSKLNETISIKDTRNLFCGVIHYVFNSYYSVEDLIASNFNYIDTSTIGSSIESFERMYNMCLINYYGIWSNIDLVFGADEYDKYPELGTEAEATYAPNGSFYKESNMMFSEKDLDTLSKHWIGFHSEYVKGNEYSTMTFKEVYSLVSETLHGLDFMFAKRAGMDVYNKEYYYDKILPKIGDNKHVLVGLSAAEYNGFYKSDLYVPSVLTEYKSLDNLSVIGHVDYFYSDNIDYVNYVAPLEGIPNILVPTIERMIVESIKSDFKYIEEDLLCEVLDLYQTDRSDLSLLKEVADHFNLSRDIVEIWLEESLGTLSL